MPNQEHQECPTPLRPLGPGANPEEANQPSPAAEEEGIPPQAPSAGGMEFRSWFLPEVLAWIPVALWPALLLLCWATRQAPNSYILPVALLLPALWRRGVSFDGRTKSYVVWHGPFVPLFRRFHDYAELSQVEIRENHWIFAHSLPDAARNYLRLELGHYDMVLVHGRAGTRQVKRFRNFSAAIVAANELADFLAIPVHIQQPPR